MIIDKTFYQLSHWNEVGRSQENMINTELLNSNIWKIISKLGHFDKICICDAGLPIPNEVERIDLALKAGVPTFEEVVETIDKYVVVQKIYLASEIKSINKKKNVFCEKIFENKEIEYISHNNFKKLSGECIAIIRTGEITPYANIILEMGVAF